MAIICQTAWNTPLPLSHVTNLRAENHTLKVNRAAELVEAGRSKLQARCPSVCSLCICYVVLDRL